MAAITDLSEALAIVTSLFPSADETQATLLLNETAGVVCGSDPEQAAYRPWIVAGFLIKSQWQEFKRVRSASGSEVEYNSPSAAFRSLSDMQSRFDAELCDVPEAWHAGSVAKLVF